MLFRSHAHVPLLGHHTSGVRKEWYRDDLDSHEKRDPLPRIRKRLEALGIDKSELDRISNEAETAVQTAFDEALSKPDPDPASMMQHTIAPTAILK